MDIKLGDFVASKRREAIGDVVSLEEGETARVVGFLLNSSQIEIMVETLDSGYMNQYPSSEFLGHWELVAPPTVTTVH